MSEATNQWWFVNRPEMKFKGELYLNDNDHCHQCSLEYGTNDSRITYTVNKDQYNQIKSNPISPIMVGHHESELHTLFFAGGFQIQKMASQPDFSGLDWVVGFHNFQIRPDRIIKGTWKHENDGMINKLLPALEFYIVATHVVAPMRRQAFANLVHAMEGYRKRFGEKDKDRWHSGKWKSEMEDLITNLPRAHSSSLKNVVEKGDDPVELIQKCYDMRSKIIHVDEDEYQGMYHNLLNHFRPLYLLMDICIYTEMGFDETSINKRINEHSTWFKEYTHDQDS